MNYSDNHPDKEFIPDNNMMIFIMNKFTYFCHQHFLAI